MARSKVVSLTVHKNTKAKRQQKEMRKEMMSAAKYVADTPGISGWAVMAIGEGGNVCAQWDTGKSVPVLALPSILSEALRTDIQEWVGSDDYEG